MDGVNVVDKGRCHRDFLLCSDDLLAVTDDGSNCIHIFSNEGALVWSIGEGVLGDDLGGITFDLQGNVWVADMDNNKVFKLSQDGRLLQTIDHAGSKTAYFNHPTGVSVSPEGLVYICDSGNHRVTVHDEEGMFLFAFGSKEISPGCFDRPCGVPLGSDGLVYVTDNVGVVELLCGLRRAVFREISRPSMLQPALLLLVSTIC